ncbi:MAG: c-type cytochrome, partial [Opitutaceae bacterium]|nr:c-type cytochrome [Opitutaceae bacterium]
VRGIHDDRGIPGALPELAALLDSKPADEAVARRTINANLRLGTVESAARLLAYSLNDSVPLDYRTEALDALRMWQDPPALDLVDGCARTFRMRPIAGLLSSRLGELLAIRQPALKSLGIRIMIAFSLEASPDQIAAIVMDDGAAADQRALALKLLGKRLHEPGLGAKLMAIALDRKAPAALHMAAMESLLSDHPQRLAAEAAIVLATRSEGEKQYAIGLLARSRSTEADAMLEKLGRELVAGRCEPVLKLDVMEALKGRAESGGVFGKLVESYEASEAGKTHSELLHGGNRHAGETVVTTHLNANCLACHSLSNNGGSEVGPNLRTIGSQRRPEELLESLLAPSAKIATGFGLVTVVLRDGSTVSGTLAKEDAAMVSVREFDGKFRHLPRTEIKEQSLPVSIMPPMQGILQPRELRDVVAFLSSLKSGRRARAVEDEDGRTEN